MAVATARKSTNGKPGPKHNIEAVREAYYERIAKQRHGAAVEGHEIGGHQGAGDPLPAPCLAL